MSNARYWATTLRAELAYNERDEALNKAAKRIATQSFKRTYSEASTPAFSVTPHWLAFGWDLFMSLVLCVPAFAAWYAISAAISFNRLVLVLGSPVLYLAYRSFGWLMRARTVKDGIEPFSIILCTVVLLPTISFEDPKQYWFKFVPNPIVRQALEWAGLGGELSVQVRGEDVGNPTAGHLIFFDGTRAWVRPCTSEAGAIIQTSTIALSYFPKDICR
jgi:hypothetical protein